MNFVPRRAILSPRNQGPTSTANVSLVSAASAAERNRDVENSRGEDEEVLPRHVQIELTRNRKRIIELEDHVKELKRLSIRKIIFKVQVSALIFFV